MTPNPECATVDTPIVDALHIMHDGKFLHLPVVDRGNTIQRGLIKITMIYDLTQLLKSMNIRCRWRCSCCC